MKLSPDIYYDIISAIFDSDLDLTEDRDLKFINFFMFSGKEPLIYLQEFAKKVKSFTFWSLSKDEAGEDISPRYTATFESENDIWTRINLADPRAAMIVRLALSHTKTFECHRKVPLLPSVIELLLNNPNFNRLLLSDCDLPTTKLLLESRKFEFVQVWRDVAKHIDGVCINTEKFSFSDVPLEEALKYESIKTDLLIIKLEGDQIDGSFSNITVSPNFKSIGKLNFIFWNPDLSSYSGKILNLLKFVNDTFFELRCVTFDLDDSFDLTYDEYDIYHMPMVYFNGFASELHEISTSNKEFKIKFKHFISFFIESSSKNSLKKHMNHEKHAFADFEFSFETNGECNRRYYKKSVVNGNVELRMKIEIIDEMCDTDNDIFESEYEDSEYDSSDSSYMFEGLVPCAECEDCGRLFACDDSDEDMDDDDNDEDMDDSDDDAVLCRHCKYLRSFVN